MLRDVHKLFVFKSLLTSPSNCFALLPQVNFLANNLNFHWRLRWWDLLKYFLLYLPWNPTTLKLLQCVVLYSTWRQLSSLEISGALNKVIKAEGRIMNVLWREKTRQIKRCFLAADLHTKDEPIMHQLLSTLVLSYYYLIGVLRGHRNHFYERKNSLN